MSGREKEIVKVRTSASGLRPYIEIDLAGPGRRLDLTEIVVGPGQDAQRSLNAASMFLEERGYDPGLLRHSDGSYRGGAV
jgi:hypothetical protein